MREQVKATTSIQKEGKKPRTYASAGSREGFCSISMKAPWQSLVRLHRKRSRSALAARKQDVLLKLQHNSHVPPAMSAIRDWAAIMRLQRTVGNRATMKTLGDVALLQRAPAPDAGPNPDAGKGEAKPAETTITISYGTEADKSVVSAYTIQVLTDILKKAGESSALITSTARDPYNQARVMYDNIVSKGVEAQKDLYAASGDQVIDVYVASKKAGKKRDEMIADMEAKIKELGPSTVSRHCADPATLGVIDVAPSSIEHKSKFIAAAEAESRVSKFLQPPTDPAYHLEISQAK